MRPWKVVFLMTPQRSRLNSSLLLLAMSVFFGCKVSEPIQVLGDSEATTAFFEPENAASSIPLNYDAFFVNPNVNDRGIGHTCAAGSIAGSVCAPNEDVLFGASIRAEGTDCNDNPFVAETSSTSNGFFRLSNLPVGYTEVTITSGSFVGRYAIEVKANREIGLTESESTKVCLPTNAAGLAVLQGGYDHIEDILEDLGFEHDVFCGGYGISQDAFALLSDLERLRNYDILFVNCATGIELRADNPEMENVRENLRTFVREGGSIYVSDLSSDFVQQLWPDAVTFRTTNPSSRTIDECCVCIECEQSCIEQAPSTLACGEENLLAEQCRNPIIPTGRGATGDIPATVTSEFLRAATEIERLDVNFNGNNWVEIESVAETTEILVQSGSQPMMVMFQPYANGGRVAYTSFHLHVQSNEAMGKILRSLIFRL